VDIKWCIIIYCILSIIFTTIGFLKGPKLEIFGTGVFAQIRPVWVGDLGTRPKYSKLGWFRPEIVILYFLTL
jgi:hypothetical protein